MYFGPQPEMSRETFFLWRATAMSSSVQGQPGWAATMLRRGKLAATVSMWMGRPSSSLKPRPPGSPAADGGGAAVDEHGRTEGLQQVPEWG